MENLEKEGLQSNTQQDSYLVFHLGDDQFGLALTQVREIVAYRQVMPIPLMPGFLRGIYNLRGHVLPVLDLAVRLGREAAPITKRSTIIVCELPLNAQQPHIGLLVDSVRDVATLPAALIDPAPAFGAELRHDFITGIATIGQEFIILLDAAQVLSLAELAELTRQALALPAEPAAPDYSLRS